MNGFWSVIVQRDTSSKLCWKIKGLNNLINLCRDPPLWTVYSFYTTTNVLLHLFTVPQSVIYSLFTLAIMMQMLFIFLGGGQENAWKKKNNPWDTLSDSISQEQTARHHKRRQHLHKPMFKLRIHTTCSSARGAQQKTQLYTLCYLLCMPSFAFQRKYLFWDPTVNRFNTLFRFSEQQHGNHIS